MTDPPPRCDTPLLIVLSGPSGVGKDAVISRIREQGKPYHFAVTATTRPQRANEQDRVDYIFVTRQEFDRMILECDLLEWAEVHGNLYGVPKAQIVKALQEGKDILIQMDVQGAATIRKLASDALLIFLAPPTVEDLHRRLRERLTESCEALDRRLKTAQMEMREASKFDHVVVNHGGRLDDAVDEIERIVALERCRVPPRRMPL